LFKEPERLRQAQTPDSIFMVPPASASLHTVKSRPTITYTDDSIVSFPVRPGWVLVDEMHRVKGIETEVWKFIKDRKNTKKLKGTT
jgi:hypothetical protein